MLYCYNKYNKIVIKPLNLVLNYIIKVIIGLGDIIYLTESIFTNKRGFKNLI